MIFYRICKERYAYDLNGKGAEKFGARWNSVGKPVLYVSDSIAACVLEIAVHQPLGIMPKGYCLITLQLPDDVSLIEIKANSLPKKWNFVNHLSETKRVGDQFLKLNKHLILKVPSVTAQGDYNYLINPKHKDFSKIKIKKVEPFSFDNRLFNRD